MSATRSVRRELVDLSGKAGKTGDWISGIGQNLTALTAPAAAGLALATKSALDFTSTITNISAVTGTTGPKLDAMSKQIEAIGTNSRYGAQSAAEAFYNIAGGVTNASSRMAILEASIHAAQAGQADLGLTTSALISIMNGYGFSAKQAGFASDVLTMIVNKGVGEMNDFATALPTVSGMAAATGIKFDDLGASMAYITTKGVSASESATQLSGIMTAFLKPTKTMAKAIHDLGYSSGQAMLKQLGLVGSLKALKDAGYGDDFAHLMGRVEGFRGALALTDDGAQQFMTDFKGSIKGATADAENIQLTAPAAQFDLLKSSIQDLSITIGTAALPVLQQIVGEIRPIVTAAAEWVKQNPELAGTIIKVVLALAILGPALMIVGSGISAISGLIGAMLSPAGLLIAAIVIIGVLAAKHFGGLEPLLTKAADAARKLVQIVGFGLFSVLTIASVAAGQLGFIVGYTVFKALNDAATAASQLVQIVGFGLFSALVSAAGAATAILTPALDWLKARADELNTTINNLISTFQTLTLLAGGHVQFNAQISGDKGIHTGPPSSPFSSPQTFQSDDQKQNHLARLMPTMDSGGRGAAGRSVLIGRGAQPELFTPDSAGTFTPAGKYMGGNGPDTLHIVFQAEGFAQHLYLNIAQAMRKRGTANAS
jgi:TP901 family phage tail tape measure protein